MIEKVDGCYEITCDECGEGDVFFVKTIRNVIESITDEGWTQKKVDDEYFHYCQYCGDVPDA